MSCLYGDANIDAYHASLCASDEAVCVDLVVGTAGRMAAPSGPIALSQLQKAHGGKKSTVAEIQQKSSNTKDNSIKRLVCHSTRQRGVIIRNY